MTAGQRSDTAVPSRLVPDSWAFDPPAGFRIADVRTAGDLASHREAWAELLLQSPAASPTLSYPHLSAFFETQVLPSETWMCLFAYQADRLVGVLPLIAAKRFGLLSFSILALRAPYNVMHTGAVDCLTLDGGEEIIELFVAYLNRIPRTWPVIRFRELDGRSASMVYFGQGKTKVRAWRQRSGRWNYIPIPATYAEFHARLSSNFKRQLKKSNNKLRALPDVEFCFREQSRSTEDNLSRFETVEDSGWKGEQGSSISATAGSSDFYRIAAERFRNEGWMEWNFLEAGGRTIGAHYGMRINRTVFLIKIAYDQEFASCSPGNLLLARVIEHACELGDIDEINCVADCDWHKNWAMQSRELHDLIVLPSVPLLSAALSTVLNSAVFERLEARLSRMRSGVSTKPVAIENNPASADGPSA
jgi:hypothetical protein